MRGTVRGAVRVSGRTSPRFLSKRDCHLLLLPEHTELACKLLLEAAELQTELRVLSTHDGLSLSHGSQLRPPPLICTAHRAHRD